MVSIWKAGERIDIYFDDKSIVIYPEEKQGFEQLFGKIYIIPIPHAESATLFGFMSTYKWVSQQENNAITISPLKFNEFLDGLKVLSDLGYDGNFKLTQRDSANGVRKYLQIDGVHEERTEALKYFVEIETIFEPTRYPSEIIPKEITFEVDNVLNEFFFHKFLDRYLLMRDETVNITFFKTDVEEAEEENNNEIAEVKVNKMDKERSFSAYLKSDRMHSTFEGKKIKFRKSGNEELSDQYQVSLSRQVFTKMFNLLRHQGNSKVGINSEESVDMFYTLDKAKSVSIYIEATSCSI